MSRKTVVPIAVVLAIMLVLFDWDFNPEFSLPHEVERLDDEQEGRYAQCVKERDAIIHAETFAAIDNPDVQREVLITRKEQAARECRDRFPERRVRETAPFRFNVVDLRYRF